MGELPSQQPPDWWNIRGPCCSSSRWSSTAASSVMVTRSGISRIPSEEALRLRGVADQQVLRLLVVVEHHPVVLAADAGLLVPAERGMRRVGVVAVGPHASGLDLATGAVGRVRVARPDAGAE